MVIEVSFAENKASGRFSMDGQQNAISAEVGGPVFASGAGWIQSIACLPLAEGYTAMFRNFDLESQKVKLMRLEVAGSETVTVPAGPFNCFKVEVTSADGGPDRSTVWIAKDARIAVKLSSVLAQMGGATMTAELSGYSRLE